MSEFLTHWTWWIAGAILVALEIILPGTYLLWAGISAAAIGVLIYFIPDVPVTIQLALFAVFAIAAIFISRKFLQRNKDGESDISLRGAHYIGREVTVENAITGGAGKVRVEDTVWLAEGEDAVVGARVKITGVNGATLRVEKTS